VNVSRTKEVGIFCYRTSYSTRRQSSAIRADVKPAFRCRGRLRTDSNSRSKLKVFPAAQHIYHHIVSLAAGINTSLCTGNARQRLPSSAMIENASGVAEKRVLFAIR